MAPFFKNLARMLGSNAAEPAVYLAAFGKHPGWNDHIDDLGLDTDDLVTAKRLLYVQGINQNIDSGAWENIEPEKRLNAFRHEFLWHMGGKNADSLIAGRLWSSVDGKGRDKYPMVLCAGAVGLPDSFAHIAGFRALAQTSEHCLAATTADQVRAALETDRAALRAQLQPPPPEEPLEAKQLAAIANSRDLAPSRTGFHRIVYQFIRGLAAYRPNAPANGNKRPEQLRVPLCGMKPADALLFWYRFSLTLLDPAVPLLLLSPDPTIARDPEASVSSLTTPSSWVDLLVGEPAPQNLFCIKATLKSIPLSSDIPYTLDPTFTRAINHFVDTCNATPTGTPIPDWPAL